MTDISLDDLPSYIEGLLAEIERLQGEVAEKERQRVEWVERSGRHLNNYLSMKAERDALQKAVQENEKHRFWCRAARGEEPGSDYQTADAPCGFCGGPMPCHCEPKHDVEKMISDDDRARNKVDYPHEDERLR